MSRSFLLLLPLLFFLLSPNVFSAVQAKKGVNVNGALATLLTRAETDIATTPTTINSDGDNIFLGGDLFRDLGISIESAVERGMGSLMSRQALRGVLGASAVASDDECKQCLGQSAKHIIESTLNVINEACKNVTCPVIKKKCDWAAEHQQEVTGVIVGGVRPLSLSFSYCMGTGECKHPNMTIDYSKPAWFNQHYAQLAGAEQFLNQIMSEFVKKTKPQKPLIGEGGEYRTAENSPLIPESEITRERAMSLFSADYEPSERLIGAEEVAINHIRPKDPKDECKKCIKQGIKWVMKKAETTIERVCEHTDCPKLKEACKWMGEHREFMRGLVYQRIRPWQSAVGYCFGKQSCRHNDNNQAQRAVAEMPFIEPRIPIETQPQAPANDVYEIEVAVNPTSVPEPAPKSVSVEDSEAPQPSNVEQAMDAVKRLLERRMGGLRNLVDRTARRLP